MAYGRICPWCLKPNLGMFFAAARPSHRAAVLGGPGTAPPHRRSPAEHMLFPGSMSMGSRVVQSRPRHHPAGNRPRPPPSREEAGRRRALHPQAIGAAAGQASARLSKLRARAYQPPGPRAEALPGSAAAAHLPPPGIGIHGRHYRRPERQQALRRPRRQQLFAHGRARLDHRPDRPERRRQVDAVQHHRRQSSRPTSGRVMLRRRRMSPACRRTSCSPAGLLRTFQIAHEFSNLTVLENLMVVPPASRARACSPPGSRRGNVARARGARCAQKADDVIDFLKLGARRRRARRQPLGRPEEAARARPHDDGRRQGRCCSTRSAAGVNRTLLSDLAANIERLNQELGYTFFVIEHDMDLIGRLCDPVIVMAAGRASSPRARWTRSAPTRRSSRPISAAAAGRGAPR